MTENASEFRSAEFDRAVAQLGARHLFIRAGRPQTNPEAFPRAGAG